MLEALLNFIFPPTCPGCGNYVEHQGLWCQECLEKLLKPHRLRVDVETMDCVAGGVWVLGMYGDSIRDMIRRLKYNKDKSILPGIHSYVEEGIKRLIFTLPGEIDFRTCMGVPVPLHREKLKSRGFNQSELIFKRPCSNIGIELKECLCRGRNTTPQFGLDAEARKANVSGAFSILAEQRESIQGKNILLVDDITTTGSTMKACSQVLMENGALTVTGLVVASGRSY